MEATASLTEVSELLSRVDALLADPASRYRETIRSNQAAQIRESQNIGSPPEVADPDRRAQAEDSLQSFYEIYFPDIFNLEWSADHLRMIKKLERAIIHGELSALAFPRGSGKTSMIIRAAIWAVVTGRRSYVAIIAATETKAQKLLKSIKIEILHNQKLREDFGPELHALVSLGNRAAMAAGQHVNGELTGVEWNVSHINFGFIDDDACRHTNNAVITAMGITGDIRGEQITTPDGKIKRPDLVLVDDPQTKKSAGSKTQVQKRHETLMGDVLGMAGPGKSIAGLAAITVIYNNDLADRLLDREQSPEWQGERCKMVYEWPDRMDMWDTYRVMYEEELRTERGHTESHHYVESNFDEMHRGAEVGWEARYDHAKETSALHAAFNLKIRDEGAFAAEYQNEPLAGFETRAFDLNPNDIAKRVVPNLYRNELPADCETVTAAIDVQKEVLFYMICGWTPTGRCYIVNYGTYPEQPRYYFTKRDVSPTLFDAAQTEEVETALHAGLDRLVNALMEKEFDKGDAAPLMVNRLSIDARYQTEVIRRFCRESKHKARINPSMGKYIGANTAKWQQMKFGKYDKKGIHCRLKPPANRRRGREELQIDTNYWKTFVAQRLTISEHSDRAIVLFDQPLAKHRMFAEHCCVEDPVSVENKAGEAVIEWRQPKGADNDWWDTLVYNCALASIEKVNLIDETRDVPREQKPSRLNPRGTKRKGISAARERMERRRSR